MVPLNILFANLNRLKSSFYLTIILASSFNILKSLKSAKRFGKLIFRKLLNIYQFNAAWCYTFILTLMMIVITTSWWSSTILNFKKTQWSCSILCKEAICAAFVVATAVVIWPPRNIWWPSSYGGGHQAYHMIIS